MAKLRKNYKKTPKMKLWRKIFKKMSSPRKNFKVSKKLDSRTETEKSVGWVRISQKMCRIKKFD